MKILTGLEKTEKLIPVITGFILIGLIGYIDYLTGHELAFSVFYVIPISLINWSSNRQLGIAASFASAIVWLVADITSGQLYSQPLIPFWNSLIRLAFFVIISILLSSLKNSTELARTDHLTAAINIRYFHEVLEMEINRFQRHQRPFTIAYIDLDNFKKVNDQFGHDVGDQVLITLVGSIRKVIRKSDFIARVGGDEFVVLFSETDEIAARTLFSKIQNSFLEAPSQKGFLITFSVGIVTYRNVPNTTRQLIQIADRLMYSAKADGKNTVKYSTYTG